MLYAGRDASRALRTGHLGTKDYRAALNKALREIAYTLASGPIENAYRAGGLLALLRRATLPDACVACGNPAKSNVFHKDFESWPWLAVILPPGLDFIALIGHHVFGKKYMFDFPLCRNCSPYGLPLAEVRIEGNLAIFKGASAGFLQLLPSAAPDLVEEINRDWLRRKLSRLYRRTRPRPS